MALSSPFQTKGPTAPKESTALSSARQQLSDYQSALDQRVKSGGGINDGDRANISRIQQQITELEKQEQARSETQETAERFRYDTDKGAFQTQYNTADYAAQQSGARTGLAGQLAGMQNTQSALTGTAKQLGGIATAGPSSAEQMAAQRASGRNLTIAERIAQERAAGRDTTQLEAMIQRQALGQGPSLAEAQMRQAQQATFKQQLAAAASAKGGSQAALQRNLLRSQAEAGQELASQAGLLRLQEMQQAQQLGLTAQQQAEQAMAQRSALGLQAAQLGEQAMSQRVGLGVQSAQQRDQLGVSALQAQTQAQNVLANLQTNQAELLQQQEQYYVKLGFDAETARQQALADYEKTRIQQEQGLYALSQGLTTDIYGQLNDLQKQRLGIDIAKAGQAPGQDWKQVALGSVLQGGATALGSWALNSASDKNVKKNIESGDKDMSKFLNSLKSYKYEYKNPNTPLTKEGTNHSIMAQDLEKSDIGKRFVTEDSDGTKIVNYGEALPAMLSANAYLNKKLNALERALKNKKKG